MIDIKNLAFSYGNDVVLKNITMRLEEGRIYGLLGENGVGKTTLLTLLCGLKAPKEGEISYDGEIPFDRKPSFLENVIFLPDEVEAYNVKAIDFARKYGAFHPDFDLNLFLNIMEEFETDPFRKMTEMSSGQLKKSHISYALACRTRYIFMDEPTNGLDIPSKTQFRKAISKHTREDSLIVISTHQVRDLENIIDPIIILDRQSVLLNASVEEISKKLFFDYGNVLHPESLYCEQVPGGFIQVYPNTTGEESKVNVEALFNAVYKNKSLIKGIFNK